MIRARFLIFVTALITVLCLAGPLALNHAFAANKCSDGSNAPDNDTDKCIAIDPAPCEGGSFLGFPKWYKYLPSQHSSTDNLTGAPVCSPVLAGVNDVWKIVAAIIELMTRLAVLMSIGLTVFGGITYITSQGNPDKTKQALKTIINALVGLVITIIATGVVSYIAGRF